MVKQAMGLGLQLVSTFWFLKIVRMMKYKLSKKSATSKNGIKKNNSIRKKTGS